MNQAKRRIRAARKAKANRLARWQNVPLKTRITQIPTHGWDWLLTRVRS